MSSISKDCKAALGILKLLSRPHGLKELMPNIFLLMQSLSKCQSVGIRLKDGEYFPYYETVGFPPEFVQSENLLCVHDPARQNQQSLYKSIESDSNIALAALMIGNQAESARKELAELQRRVSIGLPEQRSKLEADLEQNSRKILSAQENVQELKSELSKLKEDHAQNIRERERNIAQLKETIEKAASDHQRAVEAAKRKIERLNVELKQLYSEHERTVERKENEIELFATNGDRMEQTRATASVVPAKTIGRGGMMIGALSLVLGLMLGIFGAFFSEFLARAQQAAREGEE